MSHPPTFGDSEKFCNLSRVLHGFLPPEIISFTISFTLKRKISLLTKSTVVQTVMVGAKYEMQDILYAKLKDASFIKRLQLNFGRSLSLITSMILANAF